LGGLTGSILYYTIQKGPLYIKKENQRKGKQRTDMSNKKILFLHGFAQSAQIFSGKTGGLRKSLVKQGYEPVYLQGPLKLSQENAGHVISSDVELYGWWRYGADDFDVDDAMDVIQNGCETEEIEGIVGFSQGGGLTGLLAARYKELLPNLKFVIIFSGFKLKPTKFDEFYEPSLEIPSLHVIGELDTVVEEGRSLKLYDVSHEEKRTLLKHQGGHFVPNSKDFVSKVLNWIAGVVTVAKETETDDAKAEEDELVAIMNAIDNIGKA
jgi:dihydrofolate reductase